MAEKNIDAALFSSTSTIIYLTNFSGFAKEEREGFVLLTKNKNYIITDARLITAASAVTSFETLEIAAKTPLVHLLEPVLPKKTILGIETDDLTVAEYMKVKHLCQKTQHFDLSSQRVYKTTEEIKAIEKACKLGDHAFTFALQQIKENITEQEIAVKLECFIKEKGGDLSFPSIVAFGKNAAIPHHKTSNQELKNDAFILLDFGVKVDNYCSDMTRTVFFGVADTKSKNIYETVRIAQQKAIELLQKNYFSSGKVNASAVDKIARDYIIAADYPTIPHSLGHGIGLEVHESPRLSSNSKDILTKNMVFSIEPGIYLPEKTGVRIEDLFVLESTGARMLTTASKTLIEIS